MKEIDNALIDVQEQARGSILDFIKSKPDSHLGFLKDRLNSDVQIISSRIVEGIEEYEVFIQLQFPSEYGVTSFHECRPNYHIQ